MIKVYIDGDPIVYQSVYGCNTNNQVSRKVDKSILSIMDGTQATEGTLAIKGKGNFRKTIFTAYKGHRKKLMTPEQQEMFNFAYEYLQSEWGAIPADGQEADDLLATWHTSEEGIICSIDKDLLQVPGLHYNPKSRELTLIDEDKAAYLLHKQFLTGDATDNIKGIPGIGDKKATKILEGVSTKHLLKTVRETWKEIYGTGWQQELQLTADLVYLKRHEKDRFIT